MLQYAMKHRTQLHLDPDQYRWLTRQAGARGSIAGVVRGLIDEARNRQVAAAGDPLLRFLIEDPPAVGGRNPAVSDLDWDVYGA